MKKLMLGSLAAIAIMTSCGSARKAGDNPEAAADTCSTPAAALLSRLRAVVADSVVLFGHHDDTAYGHDWEYAPGRSDVLETSGSYPE